MKPKFADYLKFWFPRSAYILLEADLGLRVQEATVLFLGELKKIQVTNPNYRKKSKGVTFFSPVASDFDETDNNAVPWLFTGRGYFRLKISF